MTEERSSTELLMEAMQEARKAFNSTLEENSEGFDPAYFGIALEGVVLDSTLESVTERVKVKSRYTSEEVFKQ